LQSNRVFPPMKPRKSCLTALAAILVAAPLVTGCAMEEAEAGEAAYPPPAPPIGYTPPPQAAPPPPVAVAPPAPSRQEETITLSDEGETAPSGEEVPVGAADGSDGVAGDGAGEGYADTDPSALSDFRSTLEPYGTWTDDPTYGTVWVPSPSVVGQDFTPYVTAGHWGYDSDYAWVSDYDWGWAPFHYGRWAYAAGPGWEWIPGRTYAGAWVSWRYGVGDWGYVGWAPLPPTWCWHGGVAVGVGFVPRAPYAFVPTGGLFAPSIGTRVVGGPQVGTIAQHTRPYVPASPSVGSGRVTAHPSVGGPPPSDLHIAPAVVSAANVNNRGLTQARAFSRPETAMAMGARAPQGSSPVAMRSAPGAFSQARVSSTASHFGGRFGGGFAGSAASSPPMRAPVYSNGAGPRPYFGSPVRSSASSFRGASPNASYRSTPTYRGSAPAFSGGAYRGGASSSGGFHGGGGGSSFHGGGVSHGGGGGHGGRR
jgi:hypothetical protein